MNRRHASKKLPPRHLVHGVCLDRISRDQLDELLNAISVEKYERSTMSLKEMSLRFATDSYALPLLYRIVKHRFDGMRKIVEEMNDEACYNAMYDFVKSCWVSRGRYFVEFSNGCVFHYTNGYWFDVNLNNKTRSE